MTDPTPKIRLYVEDDLISGQALALAANQAHYLRHVMRRKAGDPVAVFNGRDGEWRARIDGFAKGRCALAVEEALRPQVSETGPWLLFAPIKRARLDLLVEKATELGATRLQPVFTRRTAITRVNLDRMTANAIEAAEQCGRLSVPEICPPADLGALIDEWPAARQLIFCDESGQAPPMIEALARSTAPDWALLIGPEGGFDAAERDYLARLEFVTAVALGPRILRTETAALAALVLWQASVGENIS